MSDSYVALVLVAATRAALRHGRRREVLSRGPHCSSRRNRRRRVVCGVAPRLCRCGACLFARRARGTLRALRSTRWRRASRHDAPPRLAARLGDIFRDAVHSFPREVHGASLARDAAECNRRECAERAARAQRRKCLPQRKWWVRGGARRGRRGARSYGRDRRCVSACASARVRSTESPTNLLLCNRRDALLRPLLEEADDATRAARMRRVRIFVAPRPDVRTDGRHVEKGWAYQRCERAMRRRRRRGRGDVEHPLVVLQCWPRQHCVARGGADQIEAPRERAIVTRHFLNVNI